MRKIFSYSGPIILLIVLLLLIYFFLFPYLDFTNNKEKSIAILTSLVGLCFGVFQVYLNTLVQSKREKSKLRHLEYKELVNNLNSIQEILNANMIQDISNVHGLVNSLMNRINNYIAFISYNDSYLFSGLKDSDSAKKLRSILNSILERTDKMRKAIDDILKSEVTNSSIDSDFVQKIEELNWHNDMRQMLNEFIPAKYDLVKKVQKSI